jgi:DNA-binding transcriptional ArsR family regulator
MVKCLPSNLDSVFHALSDPTRRAFVQEVARGPKSLTDLSRSRPVSLPLAAKHLAVLERAGLVSTSKDGRVRTCRFEAESLREAIDWIRKYEAFWEARLDRLAEFIEKEWEDGNDASNG